MPATFVLSGFGDEVSADPGEQLALLTSVGVRHLDLRGAWGRNILDFSDDDVAATSETLERHGCQVSMIASPVGKSDIRQMADFEEERLGRAFDRARAFGTRLVRMFSFYHEGIDHADCRDEVIARLRSWTHRAESEGMTLLLENEGGLWGDTAERVRELIDAVGSTSLRCTFDTGNFATLGIPSFDHAYPILRPVTTHIQIKDVKRGQGTTVAGEGDGQIPQVIAALAAEGYQGYLSLEPHLAEAGKAGGFSGPELFARATRALQRIVDGVR
jgi:sugar phosphate isomerase/epimerase